MFKRTVIFISSIILLVLACILSVRFGSVNYSTSEIFSVIRSQQSSSVSTVIMNIRIPRTIIALLVGSNLAMSGALLQSVMRNPLADPGLTGVSAGGGLAAVMIMLAFPELTGYVPIAAFIGGIVAAFMVYTLAWKQGIDPIRIILAGVAVNAILGGGISLLSILYSDRIQGVLMWLNGSVAGKSWYHVETLVPYSIVGSIAAILCINTANVLLLGDDAAKNLGIRVSFARGILSLVAAYLAGISVAVVGLIGFLGLVVPHIARLLVGTDYRYMLPISAILGGTLLVLADTGARAVFSSIELPVGILMAIIGGPFFLYLLRRGGAYRV
ncbi:FecCD family ABC transporter permease [Candidatus Contubernalis alkaliaceticus]|uniref:FecCD family ABC transporter permease n=1 Tax=Candidatus Contubernalis alkaliaceticus TaxID=338645 RepID=UPI001F4BFFD7|nr:iron ABC transporter permease [Candidatus Contubernalis alkalaceticus]